LLPHTHIVSWRPTSSSKELTNCFKPSHIISLGPAYAHKLKTSSKTLQHLPTLQGTKKEVWTHTYSRQATNR
jgi:hypothetical protein